MRTYKYKIRNHSKNKRLGNMLDELADVHNHFLKLEKRYYRIHGKYAGRFRMRKHLTKLLKTTKKHWAWIPRDTLDEAINRIDDAYQRFFAGNSGFPKPKRRHRYRSAKFQYGYKLENGRVRLSFKVFNPVTQKFNKYNKIWYSFHQHRDWSGNVRYIQISRDSVGDYWLYIVTDDCTTNPLPATGESVGVDIGIRTFATLSNGEKIDYPEYFKQSLKELRKLSKSVSRKIRGSNNYYRAVRVLARKHRKVTRQRLDWQWKLATDLCRRFDAIAVDTFDIGALKRKLKGIKARKIADYALYQFQVLLEYKCQKHERLFLKVDSEPTSKTCSKCGYQKEKLHSSTLQWTCPECETRHDRDINAAINIRGCLDPPVEQM